MSPIALNHTLHQGRHPNAFALDPPSIPRGCRYLIAWSAGVVPPAVVAITVNRAQTTYLVGNIKTPNMPPGYRKGSKGLGVVSMSFG
jgi:hypothetical protein